MSKLHEQQLRSSGGPCISASRVMTLPTVLGGILLLGLLHHPVQTFSATLPGSSSVTLAWDSSPGSAVTGYRVYYGGASGNYTNSVTVGNVTTGTVPGLVSGITYFFAVAAYTATGLESDLSSGLSFAVPGTLSTVRVGIAANRHATLTVTGQSGHTYGIEATQDFKTWTVIGTVTVGASGSVIFTDLNAANFPKRFYRTRG
jgi:hypothetical protein